MVRRMSILFWTTEESPVQTPNITAPRSCQYYSMQTLQNHTCYPVMLVIMHLQECLPRLTKILKTYDLLHTHVVPFHLFNNVGVQLKKKVMPPTRAFCKFDFNSWGSMCTLRCDHKPLEPFLISGMKIQKLDRWALELSDYNSNFIYIKGNDNILADTISCLISKSLYHELLQDPKKLFLGYITCNHQTSQCRLHYYYRAINRNKRKMNSIGYWQRNFTSPDDPKVSILHT